MLKRCSIFSETITYLGHVIAPDKAHVATKTKESIKALHYPTTAPELRSFFGLCNVYQLFVSTFAKLASLLNKTLKKGEPLKLGFEKEEKKEVDILEEKLNTPPLLTLSRASG